MAKEYSEYGVLGKPKNDLEEEIAEHIYTKLDAALEERIKSEKLTLTGCFESCMNKGHKFEVKSGKSGIARVTPEQHWKWVCDYFKVQFSMPQMIPVEHIEEKPEQVDATLSDLLNF